jgi:hypothetical protein
VILLCVWRRYFNIVPSWWQQNKAHDELRVDAEPSLCLHLGATDIPDYYIVNETARDMRLWVKEHFSVEQILQACPRKDVYSRQSDR